mgnify:CR=1 FL=1
MKKYIKKIILITTLLLLLISYFKEMPLIIYSLMPIFAIWYTILTYSDCKKNRFDITTTIILMFFCIIAFVLSIIPILSELLL